MAANSKLPGRTKKSPAPSLVQTNHSFIDRQSCLDLPMVGLLSGVLHVQRA
jgi:hypothetical protein